MSNFLEEYAQENDNQRRHIRTLQARIAKLEKVLRPFAALWHSDDYAWKDSSLIYQYGGDKITAGDLRRARALLDKEAAE